MDGILFRQTHRRNFRLESTSLYKDHNEGATKCTDLSLYSAHLKLLRSKKDFGLGSLDKYG